MSKIIHNNYCFSAVFTWTNLLVVVVELNGSESEALDLVALVTSAVLEEHHLVVGVVVVVDPGVVPINSRGEKQRMHLRDGFLADQLDPIYVAYNMWATNDQIEQSLIVNICATFYTRFYDLSFTCEQINREKLRQFFFRDFNVACYTLRSYLLANVFMLLTTMIFCEQKIFNLRLYVILYVLSIVGFTPVGDTRYKWWFIF